MKTNYPVIHHVFFWLKNRESKEDLEKLIAGVKTLSEIPTVGALQVGVVASTEMRDVIDNSWSVSELIFFADVAAQRAYQEHPIHLEFVNNHHHLWEKVLVYDSIEA